MTDITFADISEFQRDFQAPPYIAGGHRVVIVRAYNGARADYLMPARRDYVRSQPFTAVGYYCYFQAGIDPVSQARGFTSTIGELTGNEFPILDHEEGAGNQSPRAAAFLDYVDKWAGFQTTLYSGASFLNTNLGGASRWGTRPLWIASYPSSYTANPRLEPPSADFWQYSDREHFPGLPGAVDGSIYHGSADQFLELVRPGGTRPAPAPPQVEPGDHVEIVRAGDRQEMFVAKPSGEVFHAIQKLPGGKWSAWLSLGKPAAR